MASAAVPTPASKDTRAPHARRLRRSRPNSSVPRRWPGVSGGRRRFGVSTASGSGSGSHGAASATPTARTMTTKAVTASRLRAATRPTLLIPNPRIEPRVEQVDGEVDEHERERDDEHAALHQRNVAREDALDHERADAGPREHRFREDGAAEEIAGLDADDGDDRHERVLQRVSDDHAALDDALRARGADVVL